MAGMLVLLLSQWGMRFGAGMLVVVVVQGAAVREVCVCVGVRFGARMLVELACC